MFQRDFMMRMIEQVGQATAVVLGLKKEQKHEEALQSLEDLLEKHFRLNARLLRGLSDDDLVAMVSRSGIPDIAQLQGLAVLLREEADLHEELGREPLAYSQRLKSLHLFLRQSLLGADNIIADPDKQALALLEKLSVYELPARTKRLVVEWLEKDGQYAEAENWLYELEEDGELEPGESEAFYRRLLLVDEERLSAGGLTREEVLAALKEAPEERG